jgi:ERCC4-type nuclease
MNVIGTTEIIVDDREQAGGLVAALRHRLGGRIRMARLECGDVHVGDFIVERKTVGDLVASLLDGRWQGQMDRLARTAGGNGRSVLVLEGEMTREALAGMAPDELRQALLEVQLQWGLVLIRSRDVHDTANWIELLARYPGAEAGRSAHAGLAFDQEATSHSAMQGPGRRRRTAPARGPEALQQAALRRIPGVGAARARLLLREFGSVQGLLAAGAEKVAALPGMGTAMAQTLIEQLKRGG